MDTPTLVQSDIFSHRAKKYRGLGDEATENLVAKDVQIMEGLL